MSEYIVREIDCVLATKQSIVGELVRCKDCIYRDYNTCIYFAQVYIKEDDFCSRGEREDVLDTNVGKKDETCIKLASNLHQTCN